MKIDINVTERILAALLYIANKKKTKNIKEIYKILFIADCISCIKYLQFITTEGEWKYYIKSDTFDLSIINQQIDCLDEWYYFGGDFSHLNLDMDCISISDIECIDMALSGKHNNLLKYSKDSCNPKYECNTGVNHISLLINLKLNKDKKDYIAEMLSWENYFLYSEFY